MFILIKNFNKGDKPKKLDILKVGPFKIIKSISKDIYKLELLKDINIYPVFYINLLSKALKDTPLCTQYQRDLDKDKYIVEKVIIYRIKNRKKEFLIK